MAASRCLATGIKAGLMGGAALAAFFLILDLLRLKPLATPHALAAILPGPVGFNIDAPVLSELVGIAVFAAGILIFTFLHFLTFCVLGAGAAWGCRECGIELNLFTGALFGLIVCSLVFFGFVFLAGPQALAEIPGTVSIVAGNLIAGAVMGSYAKTARNEELARVS